MANIRQLATGNWQAQVRRRGIKPATKTFKTRIEASRWARLLESEVDRGVFIDRSEVERATVGELIDRYLTEVTPGKKSARQEKQRLSLQIRKWLLRRVLQSLPLCGSQPVRRPVCRH